MQVEYIAQPDTQLGRVLAELLDSDPAPARVVFVSAFVGLQTVIRIKEQVLELRESGADITFVLGIDMGGTSQEVLIELLGWGIQTRVVKHRIPGHTFHPKLYLFEWEDRARIIIGSNNITEGGFFGNYEGAAQVTYVRPDEEEEYQAACDALGRFLDPAGPVTYDLTKAFLRQLISEKEIPTEAEARAGRDVGNRAKRKKGKRVGPEHIFGMEDFELPPPLPAHLLEGLLRDVRRRRRKTKKTVRKAAKKRVPRLPIDDKTADPLLPAAFYMTLPTLQGDNIPGESRIPIEAIELAKEFWGWRDEYSKTVSPRAGKERVYWNWKPSWRIWSVESPDDVDVQEVRMYMYENSSDFRFYARPLINAGGDKGDIVRIRRIAAAHAEYECVLARQGTAEYEDWIKYCTQSVRQSTRRFGYA